MTFWVAGAAVVGTAGGAYIASQGSKSAARTQANAANQASELQNEQFQQTRQDQLAQYLQQRQDQQAWLGTGTRALNRLGSQLNLVADYGDGQSPGALSQSDPLYGSLTSVPGDYHSFGLSDFQKDPGYDFRMAEGMRGINNSAAARGGVLSGAALKAASKYNQNFASNEYSNAYNRFTTNQTNEFNRANVNQTNTYNRLASIAGVGQTAANTIGNAGQSTANTIASAGQNASNNIASNTMAAGNARASGYVGTANALNGAIGQGVNLYQTNQLMNRLGGNGSTASLGYGDTSAYSNYAPTAVTNGGWGIE